MKTKVCTFCGHSDVHKDQVAKYNGEKGKLLQVLELAIIDLIENHNVTEFYSSGYGSFDKLGANIVFNLQKQEKYSHIKSVRVLNHIPKIKTEEEKSDYYKHTISFHETLVADGVETVHFKGRIIHCNKYMVNSADFVLACIMHSTLSGAYKMYKFAKKQNKTIINLLEFDD